MTRAELEGGVIATAKAQGIPGVIVTYGVSRDAATLICEYGYTLERAQRLERMQWPREKPEKRRRRKGA